MLQMGLSVMVTILSLLVVVLVLIIITILKWRYSKRNVLLVNGRFTDLNILYRDIWNVYFFVLKFNVS